MSAHSGQSFRKPVLRPEVETTWREKDGLVISYLGGRRSVEFELDPQDYDRQRNFVKLLASGETEAGELRKAFPGTEDELTEIMEVLDQEGMLAETEDTPGRGCSGISAYRHIREVADRTRATVASPLMQTLVDGSVTRDLLVGYAIEYWHITHLCPRALAAVLARDDMDIAAWNAIMDFYLSERNHDRLMAKSLKSVGISQERLLRTQPLPGTLAVMASLGTYAYTFPVGLIATIFPMEEPEEDFVKLLAVRCVELGLPEGFMGPIIKHSTVNEDEAHNTISLDVLQYFPYLSVEVVTECAKAVADIVEQRAKIDAEIVAWYGNGGGVREFEEGPYPLEVGLKLTAL